MDMNFSPEDLAFREEVRDFLATSLPDRLKDGARRTPGVFVDHITALGELSEEYAVVRR